jgi:hypothetical protein
LISRQNLEPDLPLKRTFLGATIATQKSSSASRMPDETLHVAMPYTLGLADRDGRGYCS